MQELWYLLNTFISDFEELFEELLERFSTAMLIVGLLETFFGYKLFKATLAIFGFITGVVVSIFLCIGNGIIDTEHMTGYMLIGGIIGAVLAESLHELGVFLSICAMGTVFFMPITQDMQSALIIGIICGFAGVCLEEYAVIIMTGISGGTILAKGLWLMNEPGGDFWSFQIIGWIVGVCGIIFQLWLENGGIRGNAATADTTADTNAAGANANVPAVPALLSSFVRAVKKFITPLTQRASKTDESDVSMPAAAKALVLLPLIAGIILSGLCKSFLVGISIIAVIYILFMIEYIRMQSGKSYPNSHIQKFVWEKWIFGILAGNIFVLFFPLFPGIFLYSLFCMFAPEGVSLFIAIIATLFIYFAFIKVLSQTSLTDVLPLTNAGMPRIATVKPEKTLLCQNCGAVLPKDSAICNKCGFITPIKDNKNDKICFMCGSRLPEGAVFCGNCGIKQKD